MLGKQEHPSGAKAPVSFCRLFGMTEVMPFQNGEYFCYFCLPSFGFTGWLTEMTMPR